MATSIADLKQNNPPPPTQRASLAQINNLPQEKRSAAMLEAFKGQFAAVLPSHITPDRMVRTALTAMRQNPKLLECEATSIFASVLLSAQLGLEIGVDGQAYLIPYKDQATFVPGWKGYVDLVNRAGRATVWTGAVFKGDVFDYALGDSPFIKHQPMGESDEIQKNLTHVYAVGRVHGAQWPVIEVWPLSRVIRHRDRFNKVGTRHYSFSNDASFIGYARKVPLLQVLKYMPKSVELRAAMIAEGQTQGSLRDVLEGDWVSLVPEAPHDDVEQPADQNADPPAGAGTTETSSISPDESRGDAGVSAPSTSRPRAARNVE